MRRSPAPHHATLLPLLGLLAACGVGPKDGPVNIDSRTMLLEAAEDDGGAPPEVLEVADDHVVLSATGADRVLDAEPGQVLVSQQAGGVLRTIEGAEVQGKTVVVHTSPAMLTDVVIDGDASPLKPSEDGDVLRSGLVGAWSWSKDLGELPGGGVVRVAEGATVRVQSGRLELRPTLDLDLSIRRGRVRRFGVTVGGSADAHLALKFTGAAAIQALYAKELWASPTKYLTFWIGWVPVVVSVRAKVAIEGKVEAGGRASLTTGAGASGALDAGIRYAAGDGWSTHATREFTLAPVEIHGEAADIASASASLVVKIETKLYGAAGPWLAPVNPFAKAQVHGAPVCEATLSAGVKGAAGVAFADLPFKLPLENPFRADLYATSFVDRTYPAPWMLGCSDMDDGAGWSWR